MKKRTFLIAVLMLGLSLACRLGGQAAETPAEVTIKVEAGGQATPTPAAGLTLLEAWQAAEPQVRAWAADAQPSQSWRCLGRLTESGACPHWEGTMASAGQSGVAQVITTGANRVEVRPSNSPQAGRPAVAAAFPAAGIVDSPQALEAAWRWLAEQGLAGEKSRLKSLTLAAGPAQAGSCGTAPHYQVAFERPTGRLCLDAYSGQVTAHTFGR